MRRTLGERTWGVERPKTLDDAGRQGEGRVTALQRREVQKDRQGVPQPQSVRGAPCPGQGPPPDPCLMQSGAGISLAVTGFRAQPRGP